jgi:hypothetical protein
MSAWKRLSELIVLCGCMASAAQGGTNAMQEVKAAILSIQQSVMDLTDTTVLLRLKDFTSLRNTLTKPAATNIVRLVQEKQLTLDQAEIGVYLIAGFPEEDYWAVTAPLLSPETDQNLLARVLACPLPYGPGYCNALRSDVRKRQLEALRADPRLSGRVRDIIDFVLSGDAAKAYKDFRKDPEKFGYPAH